MTLRIKNWSKHQHFKDRTPPWIKLYRDILDDPDWHELDGDVAKVLISLWLIASEDESHQGALPDSRKLAFRLRMKESQLNQTLTKLSEWLIRDDIETISERHRVDVPETEGETEIEQIGRAKRRMQIPDNFTPNETGIECARAKGISVDVELPKFTDFHKAKGSVMLDWQAAFRTWIGNARTFNRGADVSAVTVPAKPGIDPALAKIEADAKKAAPMPAEVRELASRLKTKTLTADTARAF